MRGKPNILLLRYWRVALLLPLTVVLIAGVIYFLAMPAVPARSLSFTEITTPNAAASTGLRTFVVSNTSDLPLLVSKLSSTAGMSEEMYSYVAYLTNGAWVSGANISLGRQNVFPCCSRDVLQPHEAVTNHFKIPACSTTFRVGLDFTSLTHAGYLGFKTSHRGNRFTDLVAPVLDRFLQRDITARSRTEWSEPQLLVRGVDSLSQSGVMAR